MVFALFSNFETPLNNPQNISNDQQSGIIVNSLTKFFIN